MDGWHGFRRSKKAFMRLGHDRCDQGWIDSSGRSKEKAWYCYERNDTGKVRKQEDSLVIRWWTRVKVGGLYGKVSSIKLWKCIGTRLLQDLKVMSHPKFLLLVQMTRRKKGRREGRRRRKKKSNDVNGYIHVITYVCASALYFMKRLIIICYKHDSGKIESILRFATWVLWSYVIYISLFKFNPMWHIKLHIFLNFYLLKSFEV